MASFVLVIAITAFLAGGATGIFVMLVIGIRKGDRPRSRARRPEHPTGRGHPLHAAGQHLAQQPGRPRRPRPALTGARPPGPFPPLTSRRLTQPCRIGDDTPIPRFWRALRPSGVIPSCL